MDGGNIEIEDLRKYGEDLERMVFLRTSPIAFKFLADEKEVPEGSVRPKRDLGGHFALCQAYAMARRQELTITMLKEDHWCPQPLISFGLVEPPELYLNGSPPYPFFMQNQEAAIKHNKDPLIHLPKNNYVGTVFGPLKKVNFKPDVVLIYCNPGQLRHLILALAYKNGYQITSTFAPVGSCVRSVIPSFVTGQCYITVPDPGDYERAMAGEDEIILTVPINMLEELMYGLQQYEGSGRPYKRFTYMMRPDFPQPPIYQEYFKFWGLDKPKK